MKAFACKDKILLDFRGVGWWDFPSGGRYHHLMPSNRIQSILLHLVATLLISIGFVKTAESFDSLKTQVEVAEHKLSSSPLFGNLPCGTNKR